MPAMAVLIRNADVRRSGDTHPSGIAPTLAQRGREEEADEERRHHPAPRYDGEVVGRSGRSTPRWARFDWSKRGGDAMRLPTVPEAEDDHDGDQHERAGELDGRSRTGRNPGRRRRRRPPRRRCR